MKIGNNGHLVLGPFDESTPCLMIVWVNCQTKLRINRLTAVKSVAILESFWQPVMCEVNDARNYLQAEGLNIHQCAKKMRALQIVLEAKREEFVDEAFIYSKSLCEELEISFELTPKTQSGESIYLVIEVKMFSYRTKMT
ncbi:uncharacterized protein TNCV_3350901 [Trichonephila clavipes]|nr:uncharacterized protein TNCV_3350901 [Trichonephila clavipes]